MGASVFEWHDVVYLCGFLAAEAAGWFASEDVVSDAFPFGSVVSPGLALLSACLGFFGVFGASGSVYEFWAPWGCASGGGFPRHVWMCASGWLRVVPLGLSRESAVVTFPPRPPIGGAVGNVNWRGGFPHDLRVFEERGFVCVPGVGNVKERKRAGGAYP